MPRVDVTLRNPRDHAIAAYADELAAEIAKTAAQHDAAGSFPHDHFDTLTARGALRLRHGASTELPGGWRDDPRLAGKAGRKGGGR